MILVRDLKPFQLQTPSVAAIGNFDGLHLGHREILKKVVSIAQETGLTPTVVTFEPLPIQFFQPLLPVYRLTPLAEKLRVLKQWGIEQVICLRFNQALVTLSPKQFVEEILVKGIALKQLIVGEDFRFGYQRQGDVSLLIELGHQYGFTVAPQSLVHKRKERVSSTLVREALLAGDCEKAHELLGRFFSITKRVVKGKRWGTAWGFPTANNILPTSQQWLRGVFVTRVTVEGQCYTAITNGGTRPTLGGGRHMVESHLLDFKGDLYGKKITVEFLRKLRDEKRFEDFNALRSQIEEDKKQAKIG